MKAAYLFYAENPNNIHYLGAEPLTTLPEYWRQNVMGCHRTNFQNNHWSDLMMHYYCIFPMPRACYTYSLLGFGVPSGIQRSRAEAIHICSAPESELTDIQRSDVTDPKSELTDGRKPFIEQIVNKTFESGGKTYRQLDLFKYIMRSATFAFKKKQIELTVNHFYKFVAEDLERRGTNKELINQGNPGDTLTPITSSVDTLHPEHCKFRVRRQIDPQDGTHCYLDKKEDFPLKAAGN
jgi:hypothetical protein